MKSRKNLPRIIARSRDGAPIVVLALLLGLALPLAARAEELVSGEWGYALDLPEGYSLVEKNGTDRYHFSHSLYPAELQLAAYGRAKFASAKEALSHVTAQLASKGTEVEFEWRNRSAAIGKLEGGSCAGWAIAVELAGEKGWLVLATYTETDRATELESLFISTLDSIFTDQGSYFENGPMTAFAWPPEKEIRGTYDDGTKRVEITLNSIDAEANQSIVDREFSLLTSYLSTDLVIPAWKRYYRMIYRDAWARLSTPIFMVGNALPQDPHDLAAAILSWTQGFAYERDFSGADFTNLPEAFSAKKGDCDARALLMVLMLNQLGVDAVLLVSPEYSHAVAAVDCPGEGARFAVGNKKYLICDTTAKVGMGLIAQDMADTTKWFAVSFSAFPQVTP